MCHPRVAVSCMCLVGCQPPRRQTSVGEPPFAMNSSLNKSESVKQSTLIRVLRTPSEEGSACSVPAGLVGIQRETGSLPEITSPPSLPCPCESTVATRSWSALSSQVTGGRDSAAVRAQRAKGRGTARRSRVGRHPGKEVTLSLPRTPSSATPSVTWDVKGLLSRLRTLPRSSCSAPTCGMITAAFSCPPKGLSAREWGGRVVSEQAPPTPGLTKRLVTVKECHSGWRWPATHALTSSDRTSSGHRGGRVGIERGVPGGPGPRNAALSHVKSRPLVEVWVLETQHFTEET